MDIRKFFSPLSSTSSSQSRKSSSSDAEFKVVKHKESGRKDTKKRRKAVIESDSDEEPLPKHIKLKEDEKKRKKKTPDKAPTNVTKSPKKRQSPLKYTPLDFKKSERQDKPKPKLVDVSDFFGGAPIQRSSQKVLNNKRKNDDIDLHDDEDFKETLRQLDEQERTQKKRHVEEENTVIDKRIKREEHVLTPTKASTSKSLLNSAENGEKEKTSSSEQKKGNGRAYLQYLQREGPRALGSKEMPKGAENCLLGLTFVITGVLDSLERDEAADLIKEYGGKVTQSISKNTSYIVLGRDAGPAKLEKAKSFGTKQVDEDGLLELIRTLPGHNSTKSKNKLKESKQKNADEVKERPKPEVSPISKKKIVEVQMKAEPKKSLVQSVKSPSAAVELPLVNRKNDAVVVHAQKCTSSPESGEFMMWVDKYKPQNLKCLIGQQGDRSNANKLVAWLQSWQKNHGHSGGGRKKKPFIGRWGGSADDGSSYKAALLSGSPGIGKTTTAQLTCKECGFSFVEMNASDTRSKRSLQEHVSEMLSSTSVSGFFSDGDPEKHCLLMDEVDGMAGNEDRGGVQELIQLIKSSKVPIICMCNDRNHPKIRSLANYCFDLRFQRPRVEQIKGAMMSIAYKEGITISPQALQEIIVGANQDVRQILHLLSVFSAKSKSVDLEQTKLDAKNARKDIKKGPFDVLKMVFSASEHKTMSLYDKSDLFFHDYSIGPLFVQENYVCVEPHAAQNDKKKVLKLLSETAECICYGDLVDRVIRSQNAWNLLPVQALYASVMPGEKMEGHLTGMITFPTWLGRNSTRNKTNRILQELLTHMRLRVSANKTDLNCDYLPFVRDAIVKPLLHLQQDGVSDAVHVMTDYYLMREDIDSLMEVTLWPEQENSFSKIDSKVKAAFTRAYNKDAHLNPYSIIVAPKKKRGEISEGDFLGEQGVSGGEGDEELESSDSDLASDAMVKAKKPVARKRKHEDEPSTSKKANAAVKSSATAGKRKKK